MKKLFEFKINKEVEIEEIESSTNEKGEEVKTIKKVKKQTPQKLFLRKPNRIMFDEAELFYGVRLSEGIKAGLLTKALLAKRFVDDGGVFSEKDKEEYATSYMKLFNLQNDFQRLSIKDESTRSEDEKEKYKKLIEEINDTRNKIQDYEMAQASLFDQTAENRARNKTVLWWVLNLSFQEDESGNVNPVFGDGSFEEKLKFYDAAEEKSDPFFEELAKKLVLYTTFWYMGRASTQAEFEKILESETKES